jgi:hypothetical protein
MKSLVCIESISNNRPLANQCCQAVPVGVLANWLYYQGNAFSVLAGNPELFSAMHTSLLTRTRCICSISCKLVGICCVSFQSPDYLSAHECTLCRTLDE